MTPLKHLAAFTRPPQATSPERIADAILTLVTENGGGVSFAEIMQCVGEPAKGDLALEIAPNVILWSGMSKDLVDACALLRDKIEPCTASVIVYYIDGAALSLPIAKQLRKQGYKKPHWLPVVFNLKRPKAPEISWETQPRTPSGADKEKS